MWPGRRDFKRFGIYLKYFGVLFFNLTLAVRGNNFGIPSVSNILLELPVRGGKYHSISGSRIMVEKALLQCSVFIVKVL